MIKYAVGLFVATAVALVSCSSPSAVKDQGPFSGLIGSWTRINDAEGSQTFEFWERKSETQYKGFGYTLNGADTTFAEHIDLRKVGDDWLFEVSGVNENPTPFKVSTLNEHGFSCENQLNEFPTNIHYNWSTDTLKAAVTGGDVVVAFDFVRK